MKLMAADLSILIFLFGRVWFLTFYLIFNCSLDLGKSLKVKNQPLEKRNFSEWDVRKMSYQLEKYSNAKSRHVCPSCGVKGALTRYVDENGSHLADECGICNRLSKCGYHYPPRQYFADHKDMASTQQAQPRAISKPKAQPVTIAPSLISSDVFMNSLKGYARNNFVSYLHSRFNAENVGDLIERFGIGTFDDGRTIFWQIDQYGRVRTGKMIAYKPDGKRDKSITPTWVHARLRLPDFHLEQCLFGEHQLPLEPEKTVAVVESEKTSVIAATLIPEFVWLATGGMMNLKPERFTALHNREVILFPDADGFARWSEKTIALQEVCGDVVVNTLLDELLSDDEKAEGFDLADVLVAEPIQINESNPAIKPHLCVHCGGEVYCDPEFEYPYCIAECAPSVNERRARLQAQLMEEAA